jgi:hypothetical protein
MVPPTQSQLDSNERRLMTFGLGLKTVKLGKYNIWSVERIVKPSCEETERLRRKLAQYCR